VKYRETIFGCRHYPDCPLILMAAEPATGNCRGMPMTRCGRAQLPNIPEQAKRRDAQLAEITGLFGFSCRFPDFAR